MSEFDEADFGDEPVHVWRDAAGGWVTDFGPVSQTRAVEGQFLDAGPVIMVRRTRALDIHEAVPQPLDTHLRVDDKNRMYLTVKAENGSWTWRLLQSDWISGIDGEPAFVGRWPD